MILAVVRPLLHFLWKSLATARKQELQLQQILSRLFLFLGEPVITAALFRIFMQIMRARINGRRTTFFIVLEQVFSLSRVLREIVSTMEEDCTKYAAFDRNNVISKTADISFRLTSAIPALFMVSVSCNAVGSLAIPVSNDSSARQFLMNMDLPFDTDQSPTYELVVAGQIVFQIISGFTFSMISSLLMMTILHAGCVIDILCYMITHVSPQDEGQFRFVAMRHQEIIRFTQQIERLFTYIALAQLLTNTLILCCLGFLIITALQVENGLPLILKSSVYYVVICMEIFVYCFAGEYLSMKSRMLVEALYETSWYDLQSATSRGLVLLILKSQKGLPLTFGKFSSLSLECFANIMKASASYMSVLLAMS